MNDFNLDCFDVNDPEEVEKFISGFKFGIGLIYPEKTHSPQELNSILAKCLLPPNNDNFTIKELAAMKHVLKNNLIK